MFSMGYDLTMEKKQETKEKYIHIRIRESEKKEMQAEAKAQGFERLTDFVMWLYRQFKKGK